MLIYKSIENIDLNTASCQEIFNHSLQARSTHIVLARFCIETVESKKTHYCSCLFQGIIACGEGSVKTISKGTICMVRPVSIAIYAHRASFHKKCRKPVENHAGTLQERLNNRGFVLFAQIVSTKKTMFFQIVKDTYRKTFASVCYHQKTQAFFNRCTSKRSYFLKRIVFIPAAQGVSRLTAFCLSQGAVQNRNRSLPALQLWSRMQCAQSLQTTGGPYTGSPPDLCGYKKL